MTQKRVTWGEAIGSTGGFLLAWLTVFLITAVVWMLVDALASSIVWARYWLGRPLGPFVAAAFCIPWLILAIAFAAGFIVPAFNRGDWGFGTAFTLMLVVPTIGMGLSVGVKWRPGLVFIPGYAHLPRIESVRGKLIASYTTELHARMIEIDAVKETNWWTHVRALLAGRRFNRGAPPA